MTTEEKRNRIRNYCDNRFACEMGGDRCPLCECEACTNTDDSEIIDRNYEILFGKEENKMFNFEDIKPGYLLVLHSIRNIDKEIQGTTFPVTVLPGRGGELAVGCPVKYWAPLSIFKENLKTSRSYEETEIVEIYGFAPNARLLDNTTEDRPLLWKRSEPKKMTIEEVSQALGFEVEIVK